MDHRGSLRGFSVSGHAESGQRGQDLVCAAVSALLRTAARILELQPDIGVRGGASEDGRMELLLDRLPPARRQWLAGVTDFLVRGVRDLQEENPEAISVRVTER
ncbi:MAG: ribosomal-processing cysteine protease Prp [Spirochaetales bacterium]|nr:ribosomal-processing cysteine protease Prp [Spirochaetales bacterium]